MLATHGRNAANRRARVRTSFLTRNVAVISFVSFYSQITRVYKNQNLQEKIMPKKLVLTALLVVATITVLAAQQSSNPNTSQSTSGTSQSNTASSQSSSDQQSLEGCLAEEHHVYVITDAAGNPHRLSGDTADLKQNVGKQVRVTGTQSSSGSSNTSGSSGSSQGSQGGSMSGSNQGASGSDQSASAGAEPVFAVVHVAKVADKCNSAAK